MAKLFLLAALLACSSGTPRAHADPPGRRPAPPSTPVAPAPAAVAPARPTATAITPVELAGPYPSLAASCKAAPACGFTDMDARGIETRPATRPRCDAVLDPSGDIVGHVPDAFSKTGAATAMSHRSGDTEIRIGGVICAVPRGLRREHSMYYVFVHRADGWWRTSAPMFDYDYNDKYCGGAMYIRWNDKPTRTIAGIAAESGCLACTKQAQSSSIVELMLRVEPGGPRPAVFPFLPVGHRDRLELLGDDSEDPSCKPSRSAMSLKETWPADDEVVLEGSPGPSVLSEEGLTVKAVVGDGTIRPGRYRFTR